MRAQVPVRSATYQEVRSALRWPLLTWGLFGPAAAVAACAILGIAVDPQWFLGILFLPIFAPFLMYISLLYRNWPTGIRINESSISISAVRSARATSRTPTVTH